MRKGWGGASPRSVGGNGAAPLPAPGPRTSLFPPIPSGTPPLFSMFTYTITLTNVMLDKCLRLRTKACQVIGIHVPSHRHTRARSSAYACQVCVFELNCNARSAGRPFCVPGQLCFADLARFRVRTETLFRATCDGLDQDLKRFRDGSGTLWLLTRVSPGPLPAAFPDNRHSEHSSTKRGWPSGRIRPFPGRISGKPTFCAFQHETWMAFRQNQAFSRPRFRIIDILSIPARNATGGEDRGIIDIFGW